MPVVKERSDDEDGARSGRERPIHFKNTMTEVGFVSVVLPALLAEYFVSGFALIIPDLIENLDIPDSSSKWPAAAYSLIVSSVMLPLGRLADIYGGRPIYIAGLVWLTIWSIVAGFSKDQYMLDICRALQGLGAGAFLPSGMMLLGQIYSPGPRKNLVSQGIYGACGAGGFFVGIFFAGLTAQFNAWPWYFWIGAILSFLGLITALIFIPRQQEQSQSKDQKMDWLGAGLLASSFILFVYAMTDSVQARDGFRTPYIIVTLVLGIVLFFIAIYVERNVAAQPLLPFSIFTIPRMTPLLVALFFTYGSLGIFLLYATLYCTNIMGATSLQLVAWFTPLAIGGCLIGIFGGFILHLISGTTLVLFSGLCWIVAPLLFALAPKGANFWAWIFTSMTCATLGIDITFNVTTIFITSSLPPSQQGLAAALINSIMQLSIAICLGVSTVIEEATKEKGLLHSYRSVFWFEVGCASLALCILTTFIKIDSANADSSSVRKVDTNNASSGASCAS
ncbi:drug resistance protein [Rutstroemia sp. NJR-2017a BBW]|nr:drug resistance protein [Rutstroemia sp. NJR-2017a BBW]